MAATISQYILKLALDPAAAAAHNESPESAKRMMTEHGLSETQQEIVASLDSERISKAIAEELPPVKEGQFGFTVGGSLVFKNS